MKRVLGLLVLMSVLACGDDQGGGAVDAGSDGGSPVLGMDGGGVVRVTNVGAACAFDSGVMDGGVCQGALASCATATLQNISFPGGSCTASCLTAEECGPDGDCPFGELIAALGVGHVELAGLTAGQCLQRCAQLGQRSSCREGYACSNFAATSAIPVDVTVLPAWERPVCLPIAGDAGLSDAAVIGFDASLF